VAFLSVVFYRLLDEEHLQEQRLYDHRLLYLAPLPSLLLLWVRLQVVPQLLLELVPLDVVRQLLLGLVRLVVRQLLLELARLVLVRQLLLEQVRLVVWRLLLELVRLLVVRLLLLENAVLLVLRRLLLIELQMLQEFCFGGDSTLQRQPPHTPVQEVRNDGLQPPRIREL
jgi:hypothetical protein